MFLASIFLSLFAVSIGFIVSDYFICKSEIQATMKEIQNHNAELNKVLIETRLINRDI